MKINVIVGCYFQLLEWISVLWLKSGKQTETETETETASKARDERVDQDQDNTKVNRSEIRRNWSQNKTYLIAWKHELLLKQF